MALRASKIACWSEASSALNPGTAFISSTSLRAFALLPDDRRSRKNHGVGLIVCVRHAHFGRSLGADAEVWMSESLFPARALGARRCARACAARGKNREILRVRARGVENLWRKLGRVGGMYQVMCGAAAWGSSRRWIEDGDGFCGS